MRVLIVDDEPLARDRLKRMLSAIDSCMIVGQAGSGEQALKVAEEFGPDLVFMDVRMPGMDGLAAAQYLSDFEPPPAVIFCTAYDDYAVEAFSSQAIGYLLKPVKQVDLENAILRTKRINKAQLTELQDSPLFQTGGRSHIAAKNRRGIDLVAIADVRLFQADHKYVTAYHTQGEALLDETLKELEDEFENRFFRIHRNALISIPHIEGLERNLEGQFFVRLQGMDIRPQVSRRHVAPLRKLLEQM
ncbi:LytR/AlgR family response regulator transcription factor [Porticoccus sp.]|uniref:LytR/AlgR family response regulator transcription factor n=1 Tax=Porticoccus sp. TaxID=2024853 RepID=UPI003F696973